MKAFFVPTTSLSFSTALISGLTTLPVPSVTMSSAGTSSAGSVMSSPGEQLAQITSNSGTGGVYRTKRGSPPGYSGRPLSIFGPGWLVGWLVGWFD